MWSGKTKYKGELKLENIIVNLTHLFFLRTTLSKSTVIVRVFVCMHVSVSVCVGRGGLGMKFGLGLYA